MRLFRFKFFRSFSAEMCDVTAVRRALYLPAEEAMILGGLGQEEINLNPKHLGSLQ